MRNVKYKIKYHHGKYLSLKRIITFWILRNNRITLITSYEKH
jgi:hypothetical protein